MKNRFNGAGQMTNKSQIPMIYGKRTKYFSAEEFKVLNAQIDIIWEETNKIVVTVKKKSQL
jgi:hypothetical protein